mmetsp:Transcript_31995/g.31293  ORF Transcript_31995/g.31293 Transcript_31995/m.31293 type:complete len:241 (+) Transcript_31995:603-1325(+)
MSPEDQFILSFTHLFNYNDSNVTYFAFTYPFSCEESDEKVNQLYQKVKEDKNIYFHRETLFYSVEGRKIEVITISSMHGITPNREELPFVDDERGRALLFPQSQKDSSKRPFLFEGKRVIYFTSRVHPGETPGSHMLNGSLDLITDLNSSQAKILRKNFVFKIIPILNPDGVSLGYYRLDTAAQNLNRYYTNPSRFGQPTIWATKVAILQQHIQYKSLFIYVDFHAHASKKGGFMFGNHI